MSGEGGESWAAGEREAAGNGRGEASRQYLSCEGQGNSADVISGVSPACAQVLQGALLQKPLPKMMALEYLLLSLTMILFLCLLTLMQQKRSSHLKKDRS